LRAFRRTAQKTTVGLAVLRIGNHPSVIGESTPIHLPEKFRSFSLLAEILASSKRTAQIHGLAPGVLDVIPQHQL
jgi:hypothetical protein